MDSGVYRIPYKIGYLHKVFVKAYNIYNIKSYLIYYLLISTKKTFSLRSIKSTQIYEYTSILLLINIKCK